MAEDRLKDHIGMNISLYRKKQGLTQAGLAEKLNYSDKAVSKWERGESVPDVMTLVSISQVLGVTVDNLLSDPNALPEQTGPVQQAMGHVVEKTLKRKADKRIIVQLSSLLVWFVALFIYVVVSSFDIANSWLPFFYAVPITAIVLLSLRSAWRDFRWNRLYISIIVWGCLLCFHVTFWVFFHVNVWRVYLLGVPGQAAILLWFRMFHAARGKENERHE